MRDKSTEELHELAMAGDAARAELARRKLKRGKELVLTTMSDSELGRHTADCWRDYQQYQHDFGLDGQKTIDAKALLKRALAEQRRRDARQPKGEK